MELLRLNSPSVQSGKENRIVECENSKKVQESQNNSSKFDENLIGRLIWI